MHWPSVKVRETFLQYFLRHSKHPHIHVPSSSIVPRNDPSLAFVNAGMNQFKDVILGLGRPVNSRVTNSQKCLRINDLSLVGADTYHHTFFEMLGNWSFSNYFKAEACFMAWDLLTNVYKLDPNRMYVTYYAGGGSVPVDTETKQIWESMGIPTERVLPYGAENFWAMGPIGPCGPSTEIHYDHRGTGVEPSEVNGDSGKVMEVWNLVFMQYNRTESGQLERLPLSHVVDTGAGLERLTAVLNGKVSNYDTDLFIPIFDSVQKMSKVPAYSGIFSPQAELDRSYRVYADHLRAITVALSDEILPQTNHKIRKLIQRSLVLTEKQFLPGVKSADEIQGFLQESVKAVSSSLSSVYSETQEMKEEVAEILHTEVLRFIESSKGTVSEKNSLPRILAMDFPALARIKKEDIERVKSTRVLDGTTGLKWYESHGVTEEAAEELCNTLEINFDKTGMKEEMQKAKRVLRDEVAKQMISNEETNFVRNVESLLAKSDPRGFVCNPVLNLSKEKYIGVEWIFDEFGNLIEETASSDENKDTEYWIILNKTPFIPGGTRMGSDVGFMVLNNGCKLTVSKVDALPSGWILHRVKNATDIPLTRKSKLIYVDIDNARRFGREISAQALFNLKRWLYTKYGVVRFGPDFVSDDHVCLEFTLLKGDFDTKDIQMAQDDLNKYGNPLVVTKRIWKKNGIYEVRCATGVAAEIALRHGTEFSFNLLRLNELYRKSDESYESIKDELKALSSKLKELISDKDLSFPYEVCLRANEVLEETSKFVAKSDELLEIKDMTEEIANANGPYVVKGFKSDLEFSSLKKITRVAENKPVLVLVFSSDGFVQGRCSIPEEMTSDNFTAESWMKSVASELGSGTVSPPKGQDAKVVANLKRVRVPEGCQQKVEQSLEKAAEYVNSHVNEANNRAEKSSQIIRKTI